MDHEIKTAGVFRYLRDRPALFVGTGVHRRICLYLFFDRVSGIPDCLLHIVGGDGSIFRQGLHVAVDEIKVTAFLGRDRIQVFQLPDVIGGEPAVLPAGGIAVHVLEALSERHDGKTETLKVLDHLCCAPAVKGDLTNVVAGAKFLNETLDKTVMDYVAFGRLQVPLLFPQVIIDM